MYGPTTKRYGGGSHTVIDTRPVPIQPQTSAGAEQSEPDQRRGSALHLVAPPNTRVVQRDSGQRATDASGPKEAGSRPASQQRPSDDRHATDERQAAPDRDAAARRPEPPSMAMAMAM